MHVSPQAAPTVFYVANSSEIKIVDHICKTQLRKNIDVRHHHLVHHVGLKIINLRHISSQLNQADIMTKLILPAHFQTASATLIYPAPATWQDLQTNSDISVHHGV